MSLGHGASIVRNGLVLHLDAANIKSYPGSGTTWTDLSSSGRNGTLTNGPTHSANNSGSFVFDGTNDYIQIPNTITPGLTSFTVECWLKYTIPGSDNFRDIINNRNVSTAFSGFLLTTDASSKTGKIRVQLNSSTNIYSFTSNGSKNIADGNWNNVSLVVDRNNNTMSIFVNGIQDGTSINISGIGDISPGSNLTIGGDLAFNDPKAWFPGNISVTKIYNRALTSAEIKQNFEALRGRYGI